MHLRRFGAETGARRQFCQKQEREGKNAKLERGNLQRRGSSAEGELR